jgi:hypothetical protein
LILLYKIQQRLGPGSSIPHVERLVGLIDVTITGTPISSASCRNKQKLRSNSSTRSTHSTVPFEHIGQTLRRCLGLMLRFRPVRPSQTSTSLNLGQRCTLSATAGGQKESLPCPPRHASIVPNKLSRSRCRILSLALSVARALSLPFSPSLPPSLPPPPTPRSLFSHSSFPLSLSVLFLSLSLSTCRACPADDR